METITTTYMNDISDESSKQISELNTLFGTFRAEWLQGQLYDLFSAPEYFPALISETRPCVLVGGRGTGKTTVLRSLSYEGRFALTGNSVNTIISMPNVGMYYRADTNVVTAFRGVELTEDEWRKRFSHYLNLIFCDLIVKYLRWYEKNTNTAINLSSSSAKRVALSLNLRSANSLNKLSERINEAKIGFEAYINNVADEVSPSLSIQGMPIQILIQEMHALQEFAGKNFIFLIDEFENFEDYQQRVLNTLIKHSGYYYSFKIGVREMGWRRRDTLNAHEQLIHPADYAIIDIVEKLDTATFRRFALGVCSERMQKIKSIPEHIRQDPKLLFPGYSDDDEATELGVDNAVKKLMQDIRKTNTTSQYNQIMHLSPLQIYFIGYWSKSHSQKIGETVADFIEHRDRWDVRFGNYKHALLYTINEKKRGIRKYYAGWDTLAFLAGGNIRFFVELFYESLLVHLKDGNNLSQPVSQANQTIAAQKVGERYLSEIEGLANDGAKLKKLILGIGRILQVMAAQPFGHAPEVNQFVLVKQSASPQLDEEDLLQRVNSLINSAIMNLALIRTVGNKLGGQTPETKEDMYMMHPIFNAFFVVSYRHKRKTTISMDRFIGLVDNPQEAIRQVLSQKHREEEEVFPVQLRLWEPFYNESS